MNNKYKLDEVSKYSNPKKVLKKIKDIANELNIEFDFDVSTRKDKKYMIRGDFTNNKWIHFGQLPMEDYTIHNDEERRQKFLIRNHKWKNSPIDTSAFWAYYVLWN